jgi:hypothetical protein
MHLKNKEKKVKMKHTKRRRELNRVSTKKQQREREREREGERAKYSNWLASGALTSPPGLKVGFLAFEHSRSLLLRSRCCTVPPFFYSSFVFFFFRILKGCTLQAFQAKCNYMHCIEVPKAELI